MRKLISILIISTVTIAATIDVNACGDKTLRVGRSIRYYQNFAARHPAAILIHTAAIPSAKAPKLSDFLKEVGYKTQVVDEFAQLSEATKSGQYDIVLIGPAEAAILQQQAESSGSKTVIVPVVYKQTKAQRTSVSGYKTIVKDAEYGEDFLIAVYKVFKSREKAQRKS